MIDPSQCTGCEACVYTCSGAKEGTPSRVRVKADEAEGRYRPDLCVGCIDHPCLFSCSFGAIRFSFRVNMPVIDEKKCTGCGLCLKVCPFDVIVLDSNRKKAFKCDCCNGKPACAEACIPGAIIYTPLNKETALKKHVQLISEKG